MSNISSGNSSTAGAEEEYEEQDQQQTSNVLLPSSVRQEQDLPNKKRRKLPGNPDPSAEVIALSPKTLMATNRFICEVCNKGFQREQNLQLHRRGHNLPWKLKQKTSSDEIIRKRRVYICPEPTCIHHNPARALGDLTGIKKHYSRKHGEKKWKCDKCSKKYAVQSDWKAHSKTCGIKEYKCDCGTIFSRRDSFVTHRAFCDALTEENNKVNQSLTSTTGPSHTPVSEVMPTSMLNLSEIRNPNMKIPLKPSPRELNIQTPTGPLFNMAGSMFTSPRNLSSSSFSGFQLCTNSSNMSSSATALLQQAAQMGVTVSSSMNSPLMVQKEYPSLFQSDHNHQTQIGSSVHGFFGSMLQNGTQETLISELFYSNSTAGDHQKTSRMQNQGWYNGVSNETKINGESGKDSLTLDFLGIGGMTQRNSHDMHQQQQQQQEMSFEQQKEMSSMWDDMEINQQRFD